MVETCNCPNGCGVDLEYEGNRQWVCSICGIVLDLEGVKVPDDDCDESLTLSDAAILWKSHGKDEDYMFGYSEDELENA